MLELSAFQKGFLARIDAPVIGADPHAVYRNTVMLGLVDAIADNFPVVRQLLGDDAFFAVATEFATRHPPTTPILAHYGEQFPGWLELEPLPDALAYLPEVARCERLWLESLFAKDLPALEIGTLARGELLDLDLRLHPAARFAWLATPAYAIWQAHRDGFEGEFSTDWVGGGALFTRPRGTVTAMPLGPGGHALLDAVRSGLGLEAAARNALARDPQCDVGALFASLVSCGAFAAPAPEGA